MAHAVENKVVAAKTPIIDEIKANVEKASSAVVVDYRGLTVEQDTQLRKALREAGVVYKVYKNTYLNIAFAGTAFEELAKKGHLEGPTAVAFGYEDCTAPARVIAEFAKKAEKLEVKGGVVEGTYYDAKGMTVISSIPSREVLLSKLLGSMKSPISNIARVLKQIADKNGEAA